MLVVAANDLPFPSIVVESSILVRTMSSVQKLRLLEDDEIAREAGFVRGRTKFGTNAVISCLLSFLGISLVLNVLQFVCSRAARNGDTLTICKMQQSFRTPGLALKSLIVPELQNLRTVVKSEHPEHGIRFSNFDGPPSKESAQAWRKLLARKSSLAQIEHAIDRRSILFQHLFRRTRGCKLFWGHCRQSEGWWLSCEPWGLP